MRAVVVDRPGGPEGLRLADVPDPEPGPGEVIVDVAATAVNRADVLQRQGRYPPPPGASPYLGLECAGVVDEVGADVTGWPVGTRVIALLAGGGYAERVAVPSGQLLPVPTGLDLLHAAALPEAACTVWSNLCGVADLRRGETLLVHGGASGIGTMAIQLGVALGARVLVTAGSAAKLARCRELGADVTISYRDGDFAAGVAEATAGRGADVILDNMGAAYLGRNVSALAPGGRLVVLGLQGGARGELDLGALLRRQGSLHATSLRGRSLSDKAAIVREVTESVWPMIAAGRVVPVVDRVLPLDAVQEAHRVLEAGEHVGKIVLSVAELGEDDGHE
jgi:putative PIG3 family NAD(P)H quinone oxidoreductase